MAGLKHLTIMRFMLDLSVGLDQHQSEITPNQMQAAISRLSSIMLDIIDRSTVIPAPEILHKKAYEFLLEGIQHYMKEYHPKHQALIVMDDTHKQLNRAVAMKHAHFQRTGNRNMSFPSVVEYLPRNWAADQLGA